MVIAQNFFCAGCGTPIEPSKYGYWVAYLLGNDIFTLKHKYWYIHFSQVHARQYIATNLLFNSDLINKHMNEMYKIS